MATTQDKEIVADGASSRPILRRAERTEVYKFLEAMAWEIGRTGDPGLESRFRAIVQRVAAAPPPAR